MAFRVTMLGSGTSTGVPVIGCDCRVCTSDDPRNRRSRPGLKLEFPDGVVLIDTPTDLREQALRFGLPRVDAVVYTHAHADHLFGLDDLRIFNFRQRRAIPCYGSPETVRALRRVFAYAFEAGQEGGGKPRLELEEVTGPFALLGVRFVPIPVLHGELPVLGYRIGDFAYVTDVSHIPEESFDLLAGVTTLILGALRYRRHDTHFSVAEAIEAAQRIGAGRVFLTHLAHDIDAGTPAAGSPAAGSPAAALPPSIAFGYDGLVLDVA